MCGRYALIPDRHAWERLGQDLGPEMNSVLLELGEFRARFNVAPSQHMPIIVQDRESRKPCMVRAQWGFIPHWWKALKAPSHNINARLESAADKPLWRQAWRRSRCLIPATLWYEWQKLDGGKQAWALEPEGEYMLAGLWSRWHDPANEQMITSFAILTQAAESSLSAIHDRMPLLLAPQIWQPWIDRELTGLRLIDNELARNQMTPIKAYRIGDKVNNPRNDAAELLQPL